MIELLQQQAMVSYRNLNGYTEDDISLNYNFSFEHITPNLNKLKEK